MLLHPLVTLMFLHATETGPQLLLCWAWPVVALMPGHGRASWSCRGAPSCGGTCVCTEERCGPHHLSACNPKWKWHMRLSNSAWHLLSENIKGLWAGSSITPPIFIDGKTEAQGNETTELRSPKEAVEELGIKPRFHESLNHTASP